MKPFSNFALAFRSKQTGEDTDSVKIQLKMSPTLGERIKATDTFLCFQEEMTNFVANRNEYEIYIRNLGALENFQNESLREIRIYQFGYIGSTACREQTENSDVDIYYEGKAPSLLTLDRIQQELEELLGCSVDLVRMCENMNATLKKQIQNEGIYIGYRNGYSKSS